MLRKVLFTAAAGAALLGFTPALAAQGTEHMHGDGKACTCVAMRSDERKPSVRGDREAPQKKEAAAPAEERTPRRSQADLDLGGNG